MIAPDLRGHGDTDWVGPGGYYHFMDYLVDLDEVIGRLVPGEVILVGHSMGGSVASYWAGTRMPKQLRALALLEGLGPPDQETSYLASRTAQWLDAWRATRTRQPRPMTSLADAVTRLRAHDPQLSEPLALRLAEAGTRAVEGGFVWKHDPLHLTMGPYPFRRDYAAQFWQRITCPTLIVDGADTKLNLPIAEREARRAFFPNPRHVTLAGAGHMIQRHQPDALAELLRSLL